MFVQWRISFPSHVSVFWRCAKVALASGFGTLTTTQEEFVMMHLRILTDDDVSAVLVPGMYSRGVERGFARS